MPNKSRSEQIFDHAIKFVTPFSTTLGHPWAIVPEGPVNYRGWPLYSRRFREWLADSFQREHTVFPGLHALDSAVSMLAARARFSEFPAGQIFTRVGSTGDPRRPTSVLLHLANKNNETLEITPSGHHTRSATYLPGSLTPRLPDSHFLATASTLPLPYPIRTSTPLAELLEPLLGLSGPSLHRIIVWLFSALRPSAPYPVLVLSGPPGSGKSTLARVLRSIVDPSTASLLAPPTSERDLFNMALHNHILAFDNITFMPRRLNDPLARLATGTGLAICSRNIFDEPQLLPLARPIIVTAPDAHRAFTTNAFHVRLDPMKFPAARTEQTFVRNLQDSAPTILGSLCAAVSAALLNIATTEFTSVSRFADVHLWTAAASTALGLTPDQINTALAASPLVDAIQELLETRSEWAGSPTEFHNALRAHGMPGLPATPRALSEQVNSTALALFGITHESTKSNGERRIRVAQTSSPCVQELAA